MPEAVELDAFQRVFPFSLRFGQGFLSHEISGHRRHGVRTEHQRS